MKRLGYVTTVLALSVFLLTGVPTAHGGWIGWRPKSMTYLLQADRRYRTAADAVKALTWCNRQLIVMDYAYDGTSKFTYRQIRMIKKGMPGRKVFAYLSIGEAENYRYYWRKSWDKNGDGKPDPGAPRWLLGKNPAWGGNYRVKYWHAGWQSIIFNYLSQITHQGFDGVFLDIVDGFELFEDKYGNRNRETGKSYKSDMMQFVKQIYLRGRRVIPTFQVMPQNGEALLQYSWYRNMIAGISVENLFNNGNFRQPASHTRTVLKYLKMAQNSNKPVFDVEYSTRTAYKQRAIREANKARLLLLLTNLNLDKLGTSYAPSAWQYSPSRWQHSLSVWEYTQHLSYKKNGPNMF